MPRRRRQMMNKRRGRTSKKEVRSYRHREKRKNNPEVGLAGFEKPGKEPPRTTYQYDPHLDPQLIWAGKAEHTSFEVPAISLHVHERVSSQAIVKTVKKNGDQQLTFFDLFADPQLPLSEAVEFYQHDVDWANRLILGDSLVVMNSLIQRELLAGQVQMIYVDPPYGVAYNSNFQPSIRQRDVKDAQDDSLTREPEQIKAYRDTWTLGIHSYLAYLRDRLLLCRDLLHESGSIFVQIGDENVHLVRSVLDEVFGRGNAVSLVAFSKTGWQSTSRLANITDYLVWYAKDLKNVKYRQLYSMKNPGQAGATGYTLVELPDGTWRSMDKGERDGATQLAEGTRVFDGTPLASSGATLEGTKAFRFQEREYYPPKNSHWKTSTEGLTRAAMANRIIAIGNRVEFRHYIDDFPCTALTNVWMGLGERGFTGEKLYVVQTAVEAIQRCLLMTTDPGDVVIDPTCGSGTTAYVAEQWGRRWITCDTSRVALALARQRLLTATFPYYELAHLEQGIRGGFRYKTVPHITLKSIAQNTRLDPVFAKYQPEIERLEKQAAKAKGAEKTRLEEELKAVKRRKQAEVDRIITENAEQETLYDQPYEDRGKVRVSGPFTVESIPQPAVTDVNESLIARWQPIEPDAREDDLSRRGRKSIMTGSGTDFILNLIELLRKDGLTRMGGGVLKFTRLNPIPSGGVLHAEGELEAKNGKSKTIAVSFGPQYGPVTVKQVEEAIQAARGRYDGVAFVGFTFDAPAQEFMKKELPISVMGAYIAPDVLVGDLLKAPKGSQLFTMFGSADIEVKDTKDGFVVKVNGVDLYDPNTGQVTSDQGEQIAAWFLDADYDQRTFNICQAFFPGGGQNPWEKLARALRGSIREDAFESLRGLESLPFQLGPEQRIAVKVIDHRGNEMIEVREFKKARKESAKAALAARK